MIRDTVNKSVAFVTFSHGHMDGQASVFFSFWAFLMHKEEQGAPRTEP